MQMRDPELFQPTGEGEASMVKVRRSQWNRGTKRCKVYVFCTYVRS